MKGKVSNLVNVPTSPISFRPKKSGKMQIKTRLVSECDLVSLREAFLTGRRPEKVKFEVPIIIHSLVSDDEGVWMTDLPIELRQAKEAIARLGPKGRVLVGGLGLGVAAHMIAAHSSVESVDVIEINRDVIKLAKKGLPKKVSVSNGCIYEYLRNLVAWNYDCAFFDTWRGTNEGEWWDSVFPLRRILGRKFPEAKFMCWAEDMMLNQIIRSLSTAPCPYWKLKMKNLPMSLKAASWFVTMIGTKQWEKKYGKYYPEGE